MWDIFLVYVLPALVGAAGAWFAKTANTSTGFRKKLLTVASELATARTEVMVADYKKQNNLEKLDSKGVVLADNTARANLLDIASGLGINVTKHVDPVVGELVESAFKRLTRKLKTSTLEMFHPVLLVALTLGMVLGVTGCPNVPDDWGQENSNTIALVANGVKVMPDGVDKQLLVTAGDAGYAAYKNAMKLDKNGVILNENVCLQAAYEAAYDIIKADTARTGEKTVQEYVHDLLGVGCNKTESVLGVVYAAQLRRDKSIPAFGTGAKE